MRQEGNFMAVYKQKDSNNWWFKFTWNGKLIRESTKQSNKRVAEQIEAARKTALAKGEVGIKEKKKVPTLADFGRLDFEPYVASHFASKPKTLEYYRNGLKSLLAHTPLAKCQLDAITVERITAFVTTRRDAGLQVSSVNRELEVLRRMFRLATEWGKVDRVLPKVSMLPGENHRELVLSSGDEDRYLHAAAALGAEIEAAYQRALTGIKAQRGKAPESVDAFLLRDVATVLMDCALRPEECFRLRWEQLLDGSFHMPPAKTDNARRIIPATPRVIALLAMRRTEDSAGTMPTTMPSWVFPAPTASGHIEKSSLKKQHHRACKDAGIPAFPLYTFRHTCLTRWATTMDPYTLGYLAGHGDFSTTKRYVHPQDYTVRDAMERAREVQGRHSSRHRDEKAVESSKPSTAITQ
jgi:integrase